MQTANAARATCESQPFRRRAKHLRQMLLATALGTSCVPALVHAQDGAARARTALSDQEIIVTAQRRSERLESVPMAISVVSAETLERSGIVDIHDINRVAAGTQVGFGGAFTAPSIRGVTTLTNGNGVENNVAIYFDGFYEPSPVVISQDLANIASVEVLKGPQGTLYGRNATGGAILFNTLAPSSTLTGKVEATYARFDDKRVSAYISGPLAQSIRFSLAGYYRKSDGYLKLIANPLTGADRGNAAPIEQRSIRAKLEADLADGLTATLGYNYGYSDDPRANLYSPYENRSAVFPANDPLTASKFGEHSYNYDLRNSVHYNQGTLTLKYVTDAADLTSRTSYSVNEAHNDLDADGSFRDLTSTRIGFEQKTFQQALDLAVKSVDRLDLLFGGLYYHDELSADPKTGTSNYGPNRTLLQRTDADVLTEAVGVYVDGTYHLTDALSVNAGARYNYETKSITIGTVNGAGSTLFPLTKRSATFRKLTPRFSVRYELAPRTNVYASWSKGFRPGTFNLSPPAAVALYQPTRPETITAYELGFKTAQRGLRFNVSGFYYDYKDLNVSTTAPNPTCGTCGFVTLYGNAPKARIYGIDGDVTLTLAQGLTIQAGAAWLHARYQDFANATGTVVTAAGTNLGGQSQDWSGKQMARSPNFAGNVSLNYEFELAGGQLALSTNANYSDSYVISNPSLFGPASGPELAGKQRFRQDSTFLVNAQVSWTDPSGHATLTVFGSNLTNESYRLTYNGGNFGTYSSKAPPLTYGVKAAYKF
jgi:iron complex outermembrane receptor protein